MLAGYGGGEKGAREAARRGAAVVVVDTYRASTTIAVLVNHGARVVPVASIEEAELYPADFRIGERGSAKVQGFDFGNSPTEVEAARIPAGSTVVLSSTNGTRIVEAAHGSPAVFIGAFVNAGAVADELLKTSASDSRVMVVGCGWRGRRSSEDESAAGEILTRLRRGGAKLDERAERIAREHRERPKKALLNNTAARRLERLGYERDLDFCLAPDTVPVAPRLVEGAFVWPASPATEPHPGTSSPPP
ncbi:MAG TPA: 2-phosphosulfolactate phosphatase [Rubrobacter sp.]|nr:2-phosphosulfolactate phosphatase [Rubrobacter sp.]